MRCKKLITFYKFVYQNILSFAKLFIAIIYCILVKKYAYLAMGQGAVFGIAIWVLFHLIIMPIMHTVPAVWDQPFQEHLSEFFGHIVWMMTIELVRQHFVYRYKLN